MINDLTSSVEREAARLSKQLVECDRLLDEAMRLKAELMFAQLSDTEADSRPLETEREIVKKVRKFGDIISKQLITAGWLDFQQDSDYEFTRRIAFLQARALKLLPETEGATLE